MNISVSDYEILLDNAISAWLAPEIEDELAFVNLRSSIDEDLTPIDAFVCVEKTARRLRSTDSEYVLIQLIETILSLARRADTTELSEFSEELFIELESRFQSLGDYAKSKYAELKKYYRFK